MKHITIYIQIAGDTEKIILKVQAGNRRHVPQGDLIVTELASHQPLPINITVLGKRARRSNNVLINRCMPLTQRLLIA